MSNQAPHYTLLYFASLGEQLGTQSETLKCEEGPETVGELISLLTKRGESWEPLLAPTTKVAVNQTIANRETTISAGDEIAFFPPVTGG